MTDVDGGQKTLCLGEQADAYGRTPQRSARPQKSSIVARREFPLATVRRPASAHWTIAILCRGSLRNPSRVFNPPRDLPAARSGHPYPLDWWGEGNGRSDRRGYRYDNSLPLPMTLRLVQAFSEPGEHVVDPFVGGGTTAVGAWLTTRRFTGGDLNPQAVRFSAARLLAEHAWPAERQPSLL